jgi:hypothetical protein
MAESGADIPATTTPSPTVEKAKAAGRQFGAAAKTRAGEVARGTQGWLSSTTELIPDDIKETSGIKTPIAMISSMIRGSLINVIGRTVEITSPAWDMAAGAVKGVTSLLNPINTVLHPVKYLKNWGRIFTGEVKMAKNAIRALPTGIHEGFKGIIKHPIDHIAAKTEKIPIVRSLTGILKHTGKAVNTVMGWGNKALDGATDWVNTVHDWMDPKK